MLRNICWIIFRHKNRPFNLNLKRHVRGSIGKETVISEPSASPESVSRSASQFRYDYGINRQSDLNVEKPNASQYVSSFFGHPRLPSRKEDVLTDTPKFDEIVEDDNEPAAFAKTMQEEEAEDFGDHQPGGEKRVGQFTPLDRPIAAPTRKPREFLRSYTLTTMVNDSELLKNFVDIGVNLSKFDNMYNVADWLVKLDWDRDVTPVLRFLNQSGGVPLEQLGAFVTGNPWILQQAVDDLRIRIGYLESKKFSKEAITRIITKARYWLNFHVKTIDKRLGFIQNTFQLSGDEVRFVVAHSPKIVTMGSGYTQLLMVAFKEEMGFNNDEMRQLMVKAPKLWITNKQTLLKSFDYLHNTMGLSHKAILAWPEVMRVRPSFLRHRHEYLKSVCRDQFDPEKPNYVSLQALARYNDFEFATRLAKTSVSEYNKFLKRF